MAANLMRTLDREQFEVGAISLFDPRGTELEAILAQDGIPVWYLGKRRGFDPRIFVRVARLLERIRLHVVHTHLRVLRCVLRMRSAADLRLRYTRYITSLRGRWRRFRAEFRLGG